MVEIDRTRIKNLFSELAGYLDALPAPKGFNGPVRTGKRFNKICDEISTIANTDYTPFKLSEIDDDEDFNGYGFNGAALKVSISGLISRLNSEYNFKPDNKKISNPVVMTVNQNQQFSLTVTPITQIIEEQNDVEMKTLLQELLDATEKKDEGASKKFSKKLLDKSWQVFLQALPYILEQWGKH